MQPKLLILHEAERRGVPADLRQVSSRGLPASASKVVRKRSKLAIVFKKRPGFVAYITCGDPDLDTSREVALAAIRAGAEVIELGVPFSDPVADGPVIQRASERALKHGTNLSGVLDMAKQIREQSRAGLIIFSYLNPILQFGLGEVLRRGRRRRR